MWIGSSLRRVASLADGFDEPPDDNPWLKWISGIVLPLIAVGIGTATLITRGAIGTAVLWISAGLFGHFHYFWGLHNRLAPYSDLGKALAAITCVLALFYKLYYFAVRM